MAGIIALSTYLALEDSLDGDETSLNSGIPILLAHGTEDPVVPIDLAYRSLKKLEDNGYDVEWHEYKGLQHGVSEQEIFHIAEYLEKVLP